MKKLLALSAAPAAALAAYALTAGPATADEEDGAQLHAAAMEAVGQCINVAETCRTQIEGAAGVLVFPEVLNADLVVGGAGGNGILYVNGEPTGYYDIGKASVGLQAGIDEKAMVYVFPDMESLADLTDGAEWEVGAELGVTLFQANADGMAESGEPVVYVFDADGLNTEVNLNTLRIWEDPENAA